jgi:cellobiose phosphorylase
VPARWNGYRVTYRITGAEYVIQVENAEGAGCGIRSLALDGNAVDGGAIVLQPNSGQHTVRVILGNATPAAAR